MTEYLPYILLPILFLYTAGYCYTLGRLQETRGYDVDAQRLLIVWPLALGGLLFVDSVTAELQTMPALSDADGDLPKPDEDFDEDEYLTELLEPADGLEWEPDPATSESDDS